MVYSRLRRFNEDYQKLFDVPRSAPLGLFSFVDP
jgi:hypothetical protein